MCGPRSAWGQVAGAQLDGLPVWPAAVWQFQATLSAHRRATAARSRAHGSRSTRTASCDSLPACRGAVELISDQPSTPAASAGTHSARPALPRSASTPVPRIGPSPRPTQKRAGEPIDRVIRKRNLAPFCRRPACCRLRQLVSLPHASGSSKRPWLHQRPRQRSCGSWQT